MEVTNSLRPICPISMRPLYRLIVRSTSFENTSRNIFVADIHDISWPSNAKCGNVRLKRLQISRIYANITRLEQLSPTYGFFVVYPFSPSVNSRMTESAHAWLEWISKFRSACVWSFWSSASRRVRRREQAPLDREIHMRMISLHHNEGELSSLVSRYSWNSCWSIQWRNWDIDISRQRKILTDQYTHFVRKHFCFSLMFVVRWWRDAQGIDAMCIR